MSEESHNSKQGKEINPDLLLKRIQVTSKRVNLAVHNITTAQKTIIQEMDVLRVNYNEMVNSFNELAQLIKDADRN